MLILDPPLVELDTTSTEPGHPHSATWGVPQWLALDQVLLERVDSHGPPGYLYFWETPAPHVIVGRTNQVEIEVDVPACALANVPIYRRCSGGGAVVLGRGCLSYSLIIPIVESGRPDVTQVTRWIMQRLAAALAPLAGDVSVQGISDLVDRGRKFSGNSERWLRQAVLHHGTILYAFDLTWIERYLRMPSRQPDYRDGRSHTDFVGNLPLPAEDIRQAIRSGWNVSQSVGIDAAHIAAAQQIASERYLQPDWTHRR